MRTAFTRWASSLLSGALALSGCGAAPTEGAEAPAGNAAQGAAPSAGAPGAPGSAQGPLDLKALMAREASGLNPVPVQAEFVKAQVLASGAASGTADKNAAKLEIPIGAQAKVHCLAFREDPDAGATIIRIVDGVRKVGEVKEVKVLPMEVIKEAPVVSVAALYVVNRPGGNLVGELKLMYHSRINHSSLCFHDEVGYRDSFAKVARSFFESQDRGIAPPASSFVEVQLGHVNDLPAGFDKVEVFRDASGNRKVVSLGLVFLLRSPSDPVALDSATITTVDPQGTILEGQYLRFENGRSTLDVKLARKAGGKYDYSGSSQGKPISGSVRVKDPQGLPSGLRIDKRIAEALKKGGEFAFQAESYDPDGDPTKTKLVGYQHKKADPERLVRVKMEETEASGIADELGRMQEGQLQLGSLTIKMKRAFLRGTP
jgi:hypothetical protein